MQQKLLQNNLKLNSAAFAQATSEDIATLKRLNPSAIIVLLTREELKLYEVPLEQQYRKVIPGVKLVFYPIEDFGIPNELRQLDKVLDFAASTLRSGNLIVHCAGGFGRTGLFVAGLLIKLGWAAPRAIAYVRRQRPGAIETAQQELFLKRLEQSARMH